MAKEEHLSILKLGVEAWNQWRADHPYIIPDLRGAILQEANLQGVDLSQAKLIGANLRGANLSEADLRGAIIWQTSLKRISLAILFFGASFWGADLFANYFNGADLLGTALFGITLCGIIVTTLNIRGALQIWTLYVTMTFLAAGLWGGELWGALPSATVLIGVLFWAVMRVKAAMIGAHLKSANLFNIKYDERTVWPDGFTPPPRHT